MTKKEYADRNIGMTFDFIRQIVEYPEMLDTIADGAELESGEDYLYPSDYFAPVRLPAGTKEKLKEPLRERCCLI